MRLMLIATVAEAVLEDWMPDGHATRRERGLSFETSAMLETARREEVLSANVEDLNTRHDKQTKQNNYLVPIEHIANVNE